MYSLPLSLAWARPAFELLGHLRQLPFCFNRHWALYKDVPIRYNMYFGVHVVLLPVFL